MSNKKLSPFGDALSGAAGAVFANTLTRLQVQNKAIAHLNPSQHYKSGVDALLKILKNEGVPGLYAGLGAGLLGTLLLGAAAGALSQLFTLPIAVVTTRQQTTPTSERKEEGIPGLWKGLKASLVLCVNPAITYGMFERLKTLWLKKKAASGAPLRLSAGEIFLIGAMSKTLATVVTYPYIMAKVRMQWRPPKDQKGLTEKQKNSIKYTGSIDVLKKVFESDGLMGWYKGMQTQITKAVLCQAILFVGKDQISLYTLMLFAFFAKAKAAEAVVASA
ncbi:mitochondrial carrier domain-containing protein [Chytridium lagenaria]|nr:mitochondrial carrier domain-containing protein [Chytridium lagenaria]